MAKNQLSLYQTRKVSFFDICEKDSGVLKEETRGFYLFFTCFSAVYVLSSLYMRAISSQDLLDWERLSLMEKDLPLIACLVPCFFLYSFVAFFLQKLILLGLSPLKSSLIQHSSQGLMFVVITHLALTRPWWCTQTIFINFLAFIFFMKMHSYTMVNRDLREAKAIDSEANKYPENVTAWNFMQFLMFPVLVYQPEYPRSSHFRFSYFAKKLGLLLLRMMTLHLVFSDYILPIIQNKEGFGYIGLIFRSMVPSIAFYILIFLVLFDDILNIFAEFTFFADREFYTDWWNAFNYEEFNRRWNRPVHLFLYRHVYLECIQHYGYSKSHARYATFLFSAVCHEVIMAMTFHKVTPYLFGMMMYQFPLIIVQRVLKTDNLRIGAFWLTMMIGPAILVSFYTIALNG